MSKLDEMLAKLDEVVSLAKADSWNLTRDSEDAVFYAVEQIKAKIREVYSRRPA